MVLGVKIYSVIKVKHYFTIDNKRVDNRIKIESFQHYHVLVMLLKKERVKIYFVIKIKIYFIIGNYIG